MLGSPLCSFHVFSGFQLSEVRGQLTLDNRGQTWYFSTVREVEKYMHMRQCTAATSGFVKLKIAPHKMYFIFLLWQLKHNFHYSRLSKSYWCKKPAIRCGLDKVLVNGLTTAPYSSLALSLPEALTPPLMAQPLIDGPSPLLFTATLFPPGLPSQSHSPPRAFFPQHQKNLWTINVREGMEKGEPSCTVGGNIHWYSPSEEKNGGFLKKKNRATIWPRNPTLWHIYREKHNSKRHL